MTHEDIKILISAYIDGEVTPSEKNIVQEHLSTCAECQKEYKAYNAISSSLSQWPNEGLSPDQEMKINHKIFQPRRAKMSNKRTFIAVGATFALTIMLFSTMQLYTQRAIQGRLKSAADDIGDQFSPAKTQVLAQATTTVGKPAQNEPYYMASSYQTQRLGSKSVSQGAEISSYDKSNVVGMMDEGLNKKRAAYVAPAAKSVASGVVQSQQEYWGVPETKSFSRERAGRDKGYNFYAPVYRQRVDQLALLSVEESNTASYDRIEENGFLKVQDNPLSTFSIDVDTASYSNVRRFLNQGQLPPQDAVRVEEMINYFHYDYPAPAWGDPFSITTELSVCPWNRNHQLVLVGLQGQKIATQNLPPNNLVFLIDVSGSMDPSERLPLIKSAFHLLVEQLRPQDKVSIVVYAGSAGLVLAPTPGSQKQTILNALDNLSAGGSTAGGQGIVLAYQVAHDNLIKNGNNRVILATDGDFNIGISSDGELVRMIEEKRNEGIYLTTLGVGTDNLKDSKMQKLADTGNGNYYYIDSLDEARKVLVQQMGGTLLTIAKDVKLQVEFNPSQVKAYRLVGYEKRNLAKEDFNNDKKDAGELGAGHTVTALYEVVPANSAEEFNSVDPLKYQKPAPSATTNSQEMMTVKLRYKNPQEKDAKSKLLSRTIKSTDYVAPGSDNLRFASAVAEFGMLLRNSPYKGTASYLGVITEAKLATGKDENGQRAQFLDLVQKAGLIGEPKPVTPPTPVYSNPAPVFPAYPIRTPESEISALYREILNREPDTQGLLYWTNLYRNGSMSLESIRAQFYASDEYRRAHEPQPVLYRD